MSTKECKKKLDLAIQNIAAKEESMNQIEELSNIGSWELDLKSNKFIYSDNLYKIYGLEKGKDIPSRDLLDSLLLDEYKLTVEEAIEKATLSKEITKVQIQAKRKDNGKILDILYSGKIIFDGNTPIKIIGSTQDITENMEIKRHSQELSDLIKYSSNEIYIIDATTYQYVYANKGAVNALGYRYEELLKMNVYDTNPYMTKKEADLIKKISIEQSFYINRTIHRREDGSTYNVQAYIHPLKYKGKECLVLFDTNISDVVELEAKLKHQVNHDILTGLPNRALFKDRLIQALKSSARNKEKFALMFIDLDKFKQINDSLGHDIGDEVLVEASKRLRSSIREEDTLARIGGDEFIIILRNLKDVNCSSTVAKKVIANVSKEMSIETQVLFISASIGIAECPSDATNESSLIKFADIAMYKAKEVGGSYVYYHDIN